MWQESLRVPMGTLQGRLSPVGPPFCSGSTMGPPCPRGSLALPRHRSPAGTLWTVGTGEISRRLGLGAVGLRGNEVPVVVAVAVAVVVAAAAAAVVAVVVEATW